MKKTIVILISLLFSCSVFALGAGVQISGKPAIVKNLMNNNPVSFAMGESVAGTFKMERVPIVISGGIDLFHYDDSFNFGLGVSGDYLFFENQIVNILNWYGGAGIAGSVLFDFDFNVSIKGGVRFLIGLNWHLFDGFLEIFAQQVASPKILYQIQMNNICFDLDFPIEAGVRFHF